MFQIVNPTFQSKEVISSDGLTEHEHEIKLDASSLIYENLEEPASPKKDPEYYDQVRFRTLKPTSPADDDYEIIAFSNGHTSQGSTRFSYNNPDYENVDSAGQSRISSGHSNG